MSITPIDGARPVKEGDERILALRGATARAMQSGAVILDGQQGSRAATSAFPDWTISASILGLKYQFARLAYNLPFEILEIVELLAKFNPDYSQAVENIKTLANPGHDLVIDGPSRTAKSVKALCDDLDARIQQNSVGADGLIDKLLFQSAVYGAMAGEWVLSEDLSGVVDFMDLNPKNIRFFWDNDLSRFIPFQRVNFYQIQMAEARGQEVRQGCVRLNETTFHYYAFDSAPGNPYGTPPFLAALANIAIQKDMVFNMAQIVKKLGLLGMLDLKVQSLPSRPGESEAEYQNRAGSYLDAYVDVLEKTVREGGFVHFDDVEAKTNNITGNAAGATNIFKQNEELVFSGLKGMPSLHGRSYSTTETYAGVAYDITIRNTMKYQRAAKKMMEVGYWLEAGLKGENPNAIDLQFHSNKSLHRLQDAQAEQAEILNAFILWIGGIIDQVGAAQKLGYSDPKTAMGELPVMPAVLRALSGGGDQIQGDGATGDQTGTETPPEESTGTR